jgi:hypothetical protein
MEFVMRLKFNVNVKIIAPITLGLTLLVIPASLGEMVKSGPAPTCEAEVNLLTSLGGVKTPQNLRRKVLEAQKLLTGNAEKLELSRIARASKNASPR